MISNFTQSEMYIEGYNRFNPIPKQSQDEQVKENARSSENNNLLF